VNTVRSANNTNRGRSKLFITARTSSLDDV
jgi:hypothetical protein